ncbi:MAG: N(4)-(beta-N-acetylglucosaminyl)-L-asparaginase [Saprospiraceae bacterium]|nr:N(4)-(beta-N-acetylglucosaminyl)-L-asparaginase [Saprospiraceae bacterium]
MNQRRAFFQKLLAGVGGLYTMSAMDSLRWLSDSSAKNPGRKLIATWKNLDAVKAAWAILNENGSALDAVEAGARIPEADPKDTSVGYGGFPDRDGDVSLDACIMDHLGRSGGVMFVQNIMHPVSLARLVMEKTPHVYLAGRGAELFAEANGFKKENLLTPVAEKAWKEWLQKSEYKPKINAEKHDTIGILAMDAQQRLSGACTTSGLAFKMKGRVGDSPIIGSGLYVDNEYGCATGTGLGEAVIRKVGAFSIVEMIRQGMHPQKACEKAIKRLTDIADYGEFQVGYIAMDKKGRFGAFGLRPGFQYTSAVNGEINWSNAGSLLG